MIQRAIEITGTGRHLRKERGFLQVRAEQEELGRIPLDDLEVVLFAGHGMTCTSELLNTLAERAIPLVICDQRFLPKSMLWSLESHRLQSGRIRAQATLKTPLKKRLWQQLVGAKLLAQLETLHRCTGRESARLTRLAATVRSGDPENAEGEGARIYWPLLFGPDFRRIRSESGVNAMLNYGYTILRAAVARGVMLAGLHPAFGLHHCNLRDTMPLVDDLIEPFRPVVDLLVYQLAVERENGPTLDREAKERLSTVTNVDLTFDDMASPLSECILRMTRSLADACEGRRRTLLLPAGLHREHTQDMK